MLYHLVIYKNIIFDTFNICPESLIIIIIFFYYECSPVVVPTQSSMHSGYASERDTIVQDIQTLTLSLLIRNISFQGKKENNFTCNMYYRPQRRKNIL